jgi:hypothetical protein
MKITIRNGSKSLAELQVGTSHHPYLGPMPEVGQTVVVPEDAPVDQGAKGRATVEKILWHYNAQAHSLSPEIVCER